MSTEGVSNTNKALIASGPMGWSALPFTMGGKGKGGGDNASAHILADIGSKTFGIMQPSISAGGAASREFLGQATEGLQTGGVGAQIPLINRMVEQAKSALSKSLLDTQYSLGRAGLGKSPFGQSILAGKRIEGEANIANIGPSVAFDMAKMIPAFMNAVTGQSAQAPQALGGAASADATRIASENQAFAQIMSAAIPRTSFGYQGGK